MTPERKAEIAKLAEATLFRILGGSEKFGVTADEVLCYARHADVRDLLAALDEREQQIAAVRALAAHWRQVDSDHRASGEGPLTAYHDELADELDAALGDPRNEEGAKP